MANEELLAETNRLLRRLVEIDDEQRARSIESKKEMEDRLEQTRLKQTAGMRDRLVEKGVPTDIAELSEDDWAERAKQTRQRAKEMQEAARLKDHEYRDELLGELHTQSDLLRRICEILEK